MSDAPQDCFESLAIAEDRASFLFASDQQEVIQTQSGLDVKRCDEEPYIPVNFISERVYQMISEWEATNSGSPDAERKSQSSAESFDSVYEPNRRYDQKKVLMDTEVTVDGPVSSSVPPPLRFCRTSRGKKSV